jgi:hypothetical protein
MLDAIFIRARAAAGLGEPPADYLALMLIL